MHRRTTSIDTLLIRGALLLFLLASCAWSKALNVAVNDLAAQGVSATDAAIIGDRLRAEMVATGRFRVMERSEMDKILKEQAFQESGVCDQSECAVQIGKLLSVDRMVVGSVGKIGELFSMQVRLLDVQTGEIMFTAIEDYTGRIEGLLTECVPRLASKLAAGAAAVERGGGKADLFVSTNVPGAVVSVDGERKPGVTPLTLEGIPSGEHVVSVLKDSLHGSQTVVLAPDDVLKINIDMAMGSGSLKLSSVPPGAKATLEDGRELGETPLKADSIKAGEHKVTLALPGHLPATATVKIGIGEVAALKMTLVPGGMISLQGAPGHLVVAKGPGGDVWRIPADGTLRLLPAGHWSLLLESYGNEPWKDEIDILPGKTVERRIQLLSRYGMLAVNSTPSAFVDGLGNRFATPWYGSQVDPGNYALRFSQDGYEDTTLPVEVRSRERLDVSVTLRHTRAWIDSCARETHRARMRTLRIGLFAGSALCAAGGVFMHVTAFDHRDKADEARDAYATAKSGVGELRDTYDREIDDANDAQTAAVALDAAAGVLFGGAVASFWF